MGNIEKVCRDCKMGPLDEHELDHSLVKEVNDNQATINETNLLSKSRLIINSEPYKKGNHINSHYFDNDSISSFFYPIKHNFKKVKKEIDKSFELELYFPSFLINQIEIKRLCVSHMTDVQTLLKENNDDTNIKGKLFVRPNLLNSLKNNLFLINQHLKEHLSILPSDSQSFFHFEISKDSHQSSFINFRRKRFFYCSKEQSIFIFYCDRELAKELQNTNEFIGVKILKNGKLFAGKFNNDFKLQGKGIYINKKGHLYLGDFTDSELSVGKVYTLNNIIYDGKLKNLKRNGSNQKEIKCNHYEFIGDFENDKRIRGRFVFFNLDPHNYVKSIEINDFDKLNQQVKLVFHYFDKQFYFIGNISNKKLCGENCILGADNLNSFPKYKGAVINNMKEGKGVYQWNENDKYLGTFFANKMNSNLSESFIIDKFLKDSIYDNDENFGTLDINSKKYKVIFENGYLKYFKEIDSKI